MQQQGIPPALTEVSTRPSSIMSQRAGEADPCKRYGQGRGRQHHERVAGGRPWPSERSFVEALAAFVKAIPEVGRWQWCWHNLSVHRLQMLPRHCVEWGFARKCGPGFEKPSRCSKARCGWSSACCILTSDPPQRCDAPPDAPLSSPWQGQTAWPAFARHCGKALLPLQGQRKHEAAVVVAERSFKKPAWKRPAVKLER